MPSLFQLTFLAPEEETDKVLGFLSLHTLNGWQEEVLPTGETRFLIFNNEKSVLEGLQQDILAQTSNVQATLTEREDEDWLANWKKNFEPVLCGSTFVVLPPWRKDDYNAQGRIPIIIEPKNAFGTGQHATTALCLTLLGALWEKRLISAEDHFLDLGTGSGILAIAASKLGLSGKGLDIDPNALHNAQENAQQNGVVQRIQFQHGSLELVHGQRFSLIFANILAEPLVQMAQAITQVLAVNGQLILSGLLDIQAEKVEKAYLEQGLVQSSRQLQGEWCALTFTKEQ